jgi:hypothetical protein
MQQVLLDNFNEIDEDGSNYIDPIEVRQFLKKELKSHID